MQGKVSYGHATIQLLQTFYCWSFHLHCITSFVGITPTNGKPVVCTGTLN